MLPYATMRIPRSSRDGTNTTSHKELSLLSNTYSKFLIRIVLQWDVRYFQ